MKETLYGSRGLDQTRVRRAFGWVITFRDFPVGCWQTVGGDDMMKGALTFFTKGRAEFYLDGVKRRDRVPGILSTEHEPVGLDGEFKLVYVEPTTRVCIPAGLKANKGKLPNVQQLQLDAGDKLVLMPGFRGLVCLGSVQIGDRIFNEEQTFSVVSGGEKLCVAQSKCFILDFTNAGNPS